MFRTRVRPDHGGFWYLVEGPRGSPFYLAFQATGTGGHRKWGEITGTITSLQDWTFHALNIGEVLQVGFTDSAVGNIDDVGIGTSDAKYWHPGKVPSEIAFTSTGEPRRLGGAN